MQPTTWNLIGVTEQQDQMQLRLLKVFVEMLAFSGTLEKPVESVEVVFNVLQVNCQFLVMTKVPTDTLRIHYDICIDN